MIWFLIGAALGCLQLGISVSKKAEPLEHPVRGYLISAVFGAAVYGTILWLLASALGW